MFYHKSYAIRNEVLKYSESINDPYISFKNGSKISAETSNDNSRGLRCNILIVDEFRMVKREVIETVFRPMLNVYRMPPYLNKPEYKSLPREENKQIYMSSAWYQSHWSWTEFKSFFNDMLKTASNLETFVCSLPYQLSMLHGLLPPSMVEKEKAKETFDQAVFNMEYEGLFVGENEGAFFKLDDINKCRTINKTFIPPTDMEYIENKQRSKPKNLSNIPRVNKTSEVRLLSVDIALMGSSKAQRNDSTAIILFRLIQDGNRYRREVVYIETINHTIADDDLAVRIKQLYEDFECDYVVMDTNGIGLGVYNACTGILRDSNRDKEYEPWSCINDEEMNKARKTQGIPVIYSIKGYANLNSQIATLLRNAFQNNRISIPITDIEKRQELDSDGKLVGLTEEDRTRQLYSFYQSTAMGNEISSLESTILDGKVKIKEVGTATKDRYSALAYGNYIANELEQDLQKEEESSYEDFILF